VGSNPTPGDFWVEIFGVGCLHTFGDNILGVGSHTKNPGVGLETRRPAKFELTRFPNRRRAQGGRTAPTRVCPGRQATALTCAYALRRRYCAGAGGVTNDSGDHPRFCRSLRVYLVSLAMTHSLTTHFFFCV